MVFFTVWTNSAFLQAKNCDFLIQRLISYQTKLRLSNWPLMTLLTVHQAITDVLQIFLIVCRCCHSELRYFIIEKQNVDCGIVLWYIWLVYRDQTKPIETSDLTKSKQTDPFLQVLHKAFCSSVEGSVLWCEARPNDETKQYQTKLKSKPNQIEPNYMRTQWTEANTAV